MSRWWRDRLVVTLGPRRLGLARFAPLFGRQPRVRAEYGVEPGSGNASEAALAAFASALAERRWRDAETEVLVHGQFVRWTLLPFSEALATDAEREAYARAEFEAVHGERARAWTVRVADTAAGEPAPACALETTLLNDLRRVCASAGGRLRSVSPAFAHALDARRALLRAPVAGFAHADGGRIDLAVFERGRYAALESERYPGALAGALEALLSRVDAGGAGAGLPRRLWVLASDDVPGLPARLGDWDIVSTGEVSPAGATRTFGRLRPARH